MCGFDGMALSITRFITLFGPFFLHAVPNFGIYNIWHSVIGITIHLKNLYDIAAYVFIVFKGTVYHRIKWKRTNYQANMTVQTYVCISKVYKNESVQNQINLQLRNSYVSCTDVINQKSRKHIFLQMQKMKNEYLLW